MDQLTRDAIAAQKAGLSYGRYMAQKGQKPPVERKKKKAKKVTDSPAPTAPQNDEVAAQSERPKCMLCGRPIPAGVRSARYCCSEHAEKAREKQKQEKKKIKRQAQAEAAAPEVRICGICGKPIPKTYSGRKYCSAACADEARIRQVRESNHRIRAARLAELTAGRENT